jgi:hypothetical protein
MARSNWFRLDNGRVVDMQQLFVRVTAEGMLEGTAEGLERHVRRYLPDTISRVMWETNATLILWPEPGPLPDYTFIAHLSSLDRVPGQDPGDYSRLIVAWFQDDLNGDLVTIAHVALRHINWEAHAENWID